MILRSVALLSCLSVASSASAQGHELRAFPLISAGEPDANAVVELIPVVEELLALRGPAASLTLMGVPLASGPVDLELERVPIRGGTQVHVDGVAVPGPADHGDLSIWKGTVRGRVGSDVLLGFSGHGCHGWIHDGVERWNLCSSAGPEGDWESFTSRLVPEDALLAAGTQSGPTCASDTSGPSPIVPTSAQPPVSSSSLLAQVLECPVAIETDYQLYQVFGSLPALQNYVTLLIASVSDRVHSEADIVLTYPYVAYYTTPNDPWVGQDNGAGCGAVLDEFRAAWAGNTPAGAALGHLLSGASLGCGVAWVGTTCDPNWGFSLSCCINGGTGFPTTQGSNTWDFYVMAHELGHNLGSLHTHDYCPPLDECSTNCNGTTQCISSGTNLSYCHGCTGGMSNITTHYHPTVAGVMRSVAGAAGCLPPYCTDATSYCTATPNSSSPTGAQMYWSGAPSLQQNNFVLGVAGAVPSNLGLFFYGQGQTATPFGDGLRCVTGGSAPIQRLGPPLPAQGLGIVERPLDFTVSPANTGPGQITAASTWNFQFWYRDPAAGMSGFNLSNGLSVTFCP
jgi:hypothetical protein